MEKKVTGNQVMENENVEEVKEVEQEVQATQLFVERESFKGNDGKDYWAYIVKGKVRDRNIKVDFAPKDKGGYEPLDIVFEVSPKAELLMTNETMTDASGKKTKYVSYQVRTIDEFGIEYVCGVKPSRDSDKALLGMLLNQLRAEKQ